MNAENGDTTNEAKFSYSKNAEPFIPSFMKNTTSAPVPPTPVDERPVATEDTTVKARSDFSHWERYFARMVPEDVEFLIDLLPEDIQFMYDNVVGEHTDEQKKNKRPGKGKKQKDPKIVAAIETFRNLSDDQLSEVHDILFSVSGDTSFPFAGDNLFQDETMNADEEEWLIEQMMHPTARKSS
ncbi:hypothetical protein AGDE_12764 [Angomonas deanei]|uniref:Uncharacterized protein n=1 Tax=Angomonas deanei TaxID=59799 RepID=A0A7G2CCG7_9TRYP|nr:hypothetical protein AGDE_12764 [Angomonas deanei]CAD2216711.1 hypothetical protein, conserved [Angomonas deanei]|eukprot:EPY23554.1 hypothetical protein AGDE_12764 [Angomonas deanei]